MAGVTHHMALQTLMKLLEGSRAGHGDLALVTGGIGSGKTRLLGEFSQQAVGSGATTLTASASSDERSMPGAVVEQLFRSADVPSQISEEMMARITGATTGFEAGGSGAESVRTVAVPFVREVGAALLNLSADRPVAVIVDDVHYADELSAQLLLYLRRRAGSSRLLIVLSEWKRHQSTSPAFDAELTRIPHHRLKLAPLKWGDIRELLAERTTCAAPDLALFLEELSGGNPMLVNALVEDHVTNNVGEPPKSPAFNRAVLICLHRWESQLLKVAHGLALFGRHANPQLISLLLGIPPDSAQRAIDILADAGLINQNRFRHPAARTAVLETLAGKERAETHARVAELLHQGCPEAGSTEVAEHLVAAGSVTPGWPVAVLRAAAEQALDGNGADRAVHYLQLALTASTEDERWSVTTSLSRAVWRLNPSATHVYHSELEAGILDRRLGQRDVALIARMAVWRGDRQAVAAALRMLDLSDEPACSWVTSQLKLLFFSVYGSDHGRFTELASCPVPSGEPGSQWTLATQLLKQSWMDVDQDLESRAEHLLLNFHLEDSTVEVLTSAVTLLAYCQDVGKAAAWCDKLISDADNRGARTWQALFVGLRADIALRNGSAREAVDWAQQALSLLPERGWGVLVGLPLSTLLLASTVLGDRGAAAATLRRAVPEAMFGTVVGLRYLLARGHHFLASGRTLAAITDFQTCVELMDAWELKVPPPLPLGRQLSQVQVRLVRRVLVGIPNQRCPDAIIMTDAQARGLQLCALAASAPPERRLELLIEAVGCLAAAGDDVDRARAVADLERVRQSLKIDARPGIETMPGEDVSSSAPEDKTLCSVDGAFGDGSIDRRLLVLSDAELSVAVRAAQRRTNREIGRQLWITVSTVEQHLTKVYRKLGIAGRSELPGDLLAGAADLRFAGSDPATG